MRKNGFTLAEALIALGIVAVVAALALPMFNKAKPDEAKIAYLRTYDAIVSASRALTKNNKLFTGESTYTDSDIDSEVNDHFNKKGYFVDNPFFNLTESKDPRNGADLEAGRAKLCQALAFSFGAKDPSCSSDFVKYNNDEDFAPSFKSKDGTEFMVSSQIVIRKQIIEDTGNKLIAARYRTEVFFDINGDKKGDNCIYDKENCPTPDRFKVFILADGRVKPGDAVGQGYLNTRSLWTKTTSKLTGSDYDFEVKDELGGEEIINPDEWCKGNEYLTGTECNFCEGLMALNANKTGCEICTDGPPNEDNSACTPCGDKEIYNRLTGECELCPGRKINNICKPCSDFGLIWLETKNECGPGICLNGEEWDREKLACTCPEGKFYGPVSVRKGNTYQLPNTCITCNPDLIPEMPDNESFLGYTCKNDNWVAQCLQGYSGKYCQLQEANDKVVDEVTQTEYCTKKCADASANSLNYTFSICYQNCMRTDMHYDIDTGTNVGGGSSGSSGGSSGGGSSGGGTGSILDGFQTQVDIYEDSATVIN